MLGAHPKSPKLHQKRDLGEIGQKAASRALKAARKGSKNALFDVHIFNPPSKKNSNKAAAPNPANKTK